MSLSRFQMVNLVKCEVCAYVYTGAGAADKVGVDFSDIW